MCHKGHLYETRTVGKVFVAVSLRFASFSPLKHLDETITSPQRKQRNKRNHKSFCCLTFFFLLLVFLKQQKCLHQWSQYSHSVPSLEGGNKLKQQQQHFPAHFMSPLTTQWMKSYSHLNSWTSLVWALPKELFTHDMWPSRPSRTSPRGQPKEQISRLQAVWQRKKFRSSWDAQRLEGGS